jgi:hypothetical protein
MTTALGVASLTSLAMCLASPFLYFWGSVGVESYKNLLLASSLAYFAAATTWAARRGRRR